jgi:hypothetical protein
MDYSPNWERVDNRMNAFPSSETSNPYFEKSGAQLDSTFQWEPVNSESGNVESVAMVGSGSDKETPSLYVKFKGGRIYSYKDTSAMYGRGETPESVYGKIKAEGGEAIWEHLRAPESIRAPYQITGMPHPKGEAKTGTGLYPWAGDKHWSKYELEAGKSAPISTQQFEEKVETLKTQTTGEISADIEQPSEAQPEIEQPTKIKPIMTALVGGLVETKPQPTIQPPPLTPPQPTTQPTPIRTPLQQTEFRPPSGTVTVVQPTQPTQPGAKPVEQTSIVYGGAPTPTPKEAEFGPRAKPVAGVRSVYVGRRPFQGKKKNEIPEEFLGNDYQYWFGGINKIAEIFRVNNQGVYDLMNAVEDHIKFNRIGGKLDHSDDDYWYVITNGFSATNPFQYLENGRLRVEYQCADSIRANVGKVVPMGVYHHLDDPNSTDVAEWQRVGTYEVKTFDENTKEDVAIIKVNKKAVAEFFKKKGDDDWITPMFNEGICPDISTAYPCKVKWNEEHRVYLQTDMDLTSVSFVPTGNCSSPYCTSDLVRFNEASKESIKECVHNKIKIIIDEMKAKNNVDREAAIGKAFGICEGNKKKNQDWMELIKKINVKN